ncbi:hypothetical protein Tsubulata_003872 [Turnera subulata]|uniref:Glutamine amidotransferase domain-containing protein n=1 Tax=Turnera subulata TaxID=218843 RepID=A0A9Q0G635_9ROSI|nr:hypothetical protein Tsubulata_003872 [Turnera subulata]
MEQYGQGQGQRQPTQEGLHLHPHFKNPSHQPPPTATTKKMDPKAVKSDLVLILDYGSQYTHLITRRIRSLNVFSLCINSTSSLDTITSHNPKVVILSGGPHSPNSPTFPAGFAEWAQVIGCFVLEICYGLQLIVQAGGSGGGGGEAGGPDAAESGLLQRKKEAIEALPEKLRVAALVSDLTPFPKARFMATLTPPIEAIVVGMVMFVRVWLCGLLFDGSGGWWVEGEKNWLTAEEKSKKREGMDGEDKVGVVTAVVLTRWWRSS